MGGSVICGRHQHIKKRKKRHRVCFPLGFFFPLTEASIHSACWSGGGPSPCPPRPPQLIRTQSKHPSSHKSTPAFQQWDSPLINPCPVTRGRLYTDLYLRYIGLNTERGLLHIFNTRGHIPHMGTKQSFALKPRCRPHTLNTHLLCATGKNTYNSIYFLMSSFHIYWISNWGGQNEW